MPGSEVVVNGDVTVEEGGGLYAVSGYDNSEIFKNIDKKLTRYQDSNDTTRSYIFDLGQYNMMKEIVFSLARKYYPSATLLKAAGFSASGNLLVSGTVTVKNGGDLGGRINAEEGGTLSLEQGAGMGRVLNLGGPYNEPKGMFYNDTFGIKAAKELGLSLCFMTAVYVPCFLEVYDSANANLLEQVDGEEPKYYQSGNSANESIKFKCTGFGLAKDVYTNLNLSDTENAPGSKYVTWVEENAEKVVNLNPVEVRTAKSAITFTMGKVTSQTLDKVTITDFTVKYTKDGTEHLWDYQVKVASQTALKTVIPLIIEDREITVNSQYSTGWAISD